MQRTNHDIFLSLTRTKLNEKDGSERRPSRNENPECSPRFFNRFNGLLTALTEPGTCSTHASYSRIKTTVLIRRFDLNSFGTSRAAQVLYFLILKRQLPVCRLQNFSIIISEINSKRLVG